MPARRLLLIGAVPAAALVLAGCGSSSKPSTPAPTVTATATATATVTATTTASAAPTASVRPATSTQCGTPDLSAQVHDQDSGAGQRYAAIVLTNTSANSCTIGGYPGMQLVASSGKPVPTQVVRIATPAPRVLTLKPGAKASSGIAFGVIASGSEPVNGPCEPQASTIRITPPNARTSLTAPWTLGPVCAKGRISTNALVAGTGG